MRNGGCCDLSYKDSNGVGNGDVFFDFNVGHSPVLSWRNVEIELIEDRGLSLRGDEFFMKDFELIEMFACPVYKGVSAIQ